MSPFILELSWNYLKFLYAPLMYPEMLWILVPVFLSNLLMELYFERYPREGIGHHRSLENTIFMIFIAFNLFTHSGFLTYQFYAAVVFTIFLVFIGILDFMHKLPTELIFKRSSKFMITFFAYLCIILVYSDMLDSPSIVTLLAITLAVIGFLLTVLAIRLIITVLEPKSYEELEHFLHNIEVEIRKSHEASEKKSQEIPRKVVQEKKTA